jgi:hypothetical protein
MAHLQVGSRSLARIVSLATGVTVWSCGAATDVPSSDQRIRNATSAEAAPGAQPIEGHATSSPGLTRETALGATWQELGIPAASNGPDLASTPSGWFALSQRSVGDARAPSAWESYLYRSSDGIRWQAVHVSDETDNLWLRGVAYGEGQYVLAGMRMGGSDGAIFHSTDGEHWQEITVATGAPSGLSDVVFSGGQFFALSTFRTLLRSANGIDWQAIDLATTVMPLDVTFGRDQFLLVGSGDVQRSSDGLRWQPSHLDCDMPGACITTPDGDVLQGLHTRVVFAAGAYFIDQASSADGRSWQALPGLHPEASIDGLVLGSSTESELALWGPGEAPQSLDNVRYIATLSDADRTERMRWNGSIHPNEQTIENFPNGEPLPEQLEFPLPSSADCTTARCVVVGNRLYLLSDAP